MNNTACTIPIQELCYTKFIPSLRTCIPGFGLSIPRLGIDSANHKQSFFLTDKNLFTLTKKNFLLNREDFSLNTLNFFSAISFLPTIKSLISCRTIYHIFNMEVVTNNWFTKNIHRFCLKRRFHQRLCPFGCHAILIGT
mgnify:CR=1 FL=1